MNPDGQPVIPARPLRPPPPFSGPNGFYLLSSDDPTQLGPSSQVGSVFTYVLGRNPQIGEQYTWLDAAIQTYYTTTYTATGWNNGEPVTNLGQSAFFDIGPTIPGDFSRTGTINAADLDLLYANFTSKTGVYNPIYDVNGDGVVNQADVTYLLRNILHTNYATPTWMDTRISPISRPCFTTGRDTTPDGHRGISTVTGSWTTPISRFCWTTGIPAGGTHLPRSPNRQR